MARSVEERLKALRDVNPATAAGMKELRDALASKVGVLVAGAAKHVETSSLDAVVPELVAAFEQLCEQGIKRDPGCRGRVAIARTLHALNQWEDRVFVAGLTVVQLEGMSPDDTAAQLRGLCGIAHAHFGRSDTLDVLAELLADEWRTARLAAAQALGDSGQLGATALLRLRIRAGETEPEVLAAALESLLSLDRDGQLAFVLGLLDAHDETGEAAALALGGARIAAAFEPLRAWCMGASPEQRRRVGYLALALLRSDPANEHLLELVRAASKADALAAASALATFKADPALADALAAAGKANHDAAVRREIAALLAAG